MRTIAMRIPTRRVLEGGGFEVRRPAAMGVEMSPFLLLDEMGPTNWGPGEAIGAPSHPHRGFEAVTYLLKGKLEHKDSAGNSGSLREGDVQWMTAGGGVIHSELPEPEFKRKGGLMHGFQIWVNLPAKDKMMAPRYQDIPASDIPVAESENGSVKVVVVAGESMGVDAIIDTMIPITYLDVTLKDGELKQNLASELNAMVYVFEGTLNIGGE
ncbi:MAG: pirin family protein, partial [Candidatus Poseidoniaceae archaeon]|nr:pirin family protein [Candidatus Poseidoniaceae archaeon]